MYPKSLGAVNLSPCAEAATTSATTSDDVFTDASAEGLLAFAAAPDLLHRSSASPIDTVEALNHVADPKAAFPGR